MTPEQHKEKIKKQTENMPAPMVGVMGGETEPAGHPYDVTDGIIAYESGELDEDGTIELFQHLVDTGLVMAGATGQIVGYSPKR
jgi:hypothetical protein